ncbi:PIR protein [Plasmodium yoelii]|uniref:PIR protein n=2 Tax=Plasmodium yoelii TaxID=5861 RepID=A0AAE9X261_PLAYO|nr:PIR protein [Plasmodium yoelii]WBY60488.1 PIR protein [Plasmodium yoelii yoelii]VTZ81096.1 PIR protein [Plasmodium yoelii]|eukprot:XP_022813788.1 PIR protein [Plasmodium yoelii]
MADLLCGEFDSLRKLFRDGLKDSKEYDFNNGIFNKYCPNGKCDADTDIVNAGCLWLFNAFFGKTGTSNYEDRYKDVIVCIMIWLCYKLSLKTFHNITTLNDFYSNHIENNTKYTNSEVNDEKFKSYKEIIDEIKGYMDINISHMSKFDELLKLLCNMNSAYTSKNSRKCSEHANNFVNKYNELLNDDNNNDGSSYSKVLLVLSNYYNNFEKNRIFHYITINLPSLPTKKTAENIGISDSKESQAVSSIETAESNSETKVSNFDSTSPSSSISNKLISIPFILIATLILLGIAYKYSLFGLRKRSQKHLREKIKK